MKNEQKQQREFIAFEGEKFTIEWHFDNKGKSISLEYLESLDDEEQAKLFELMKLMGNTGTNGFHKKTDKLPKNEKERALKIKSDYETRVKRGDYYE
jgi:hypothetical protein